MDIAALKAELAAAHPVTGAYSADAIEAAGQLNAVNRTRNRTSMTGSEVLQAIDATEYASLSDAQKLQVLSLLGIGDVNPFGAEASILTDIFTAPSATITALATARVEAISRATELGFGLIRAGDVQRARAE